MVRHFQCDLRKTSPLPWNRDLDIRERMAHGGLMMIYCRCCGTCRMKTCQSCQSSDVVAVREVGKRHGE